MKKYITILILMFTVSSLHAFDELKAYGFDQDWGLYHGMAFGCTLLRVKDGGDFSTEKTGICAEWFQGYRCADLPIQFEQKITMNYHCFGKINQENPYIGETDHPYKSYGVTENVIFDLSDRRSSGPYFGWGFGFRKLKSVKKELFSGRKVIRKIRSMGMQGIVGMNFRVFPILDCQVEYKCFRARKYAFMEHSVCLNFKAFL